MAGNAGVDDVVANTLTVLEAAGRPDVPVARGAARPLLEPARHARHVHGEDGMGDLGWPRATRGADPRHAVELLRDVLAEAAAGGEDDRITLVPLAPLTNIALLLRTWPEAAAGLRRIVVHGRRGRCRQRHRLGRVQRLARPRGGRHRPGVRGRARRPGDDVRAGRLLRRPGRPASRRRTWSAAVAPPSWPGGSCCTSASASARRTPRSGTPARCVPSSAPDALTTLPLPVRVELTGTWSRGRTIVDRRDWSGDLAHDPHGLPAAMVDVALEVDGRRCSALWLDTVGGA